MNYKLKTTTGGQFNVVETQTNQTVKSFSVQKEAREFLRHLNFGGGFDGFTPSFILKNFSLTFKKPAKVR